MKLFASFIPNLVKFAGEQDFVFVWMAYSLESKTQYDFWKNEWKFRPNQIKHWFLVLFGSSLKNNNLKKRFIAGDMGLFIQIVPEYILKFKGEKCFGGKK